MPWVQKWDSTRRQHDRGPQRAQKRNGRFARLIADLRREEKPGTATHQSRSIPSDAPTQAHRGEGQGVFAKRPLHTRAPQEARTGRGGRDLPAAQHPTSDGSHKRKITNDLALEAKVKALDTAPTVVKNQPMNFIQMAVIHKVYHDITRQPPEWWMCCMAEKLGR